MNKTELQTVLEALEGADRIDTDMRDAIALLQAAIAAPEDEPVEITELMQLVYDYADAFHDRLERIDAGDHHNILPMKAIQTGIRDQIRDQLALLYAPKVLIL